MIRIGTAGLIGYETAAKLREEHRDELALRFSRTFLKTFDRLKEQNISAEQITSLVKADGVYYSGKSPTEMLTPAPAVYISEISEGGLFAALWKACEEWKLLRYGNKGVSVGCIVDLDSIPVMQEVIEISELYAENPYEVPSCGAYLLVWDEDAAENMDESVEKFLADSCIIGRITGGNDRVLKGNELMRFLTPPSRQNKDIKDRKTMP